MHTWASRIKTRMKEIGITQEALANKMGITRGAITHYLAGRREPPLRQFQKLADILDTDPAWLQFGTTPSEGNLNTANNKDKPTKTHLIPILTWEQAAKWTGSKKMTMEELKEFIPHLYTNKSNLFGLRIRGDSMTAPTGQSKSFHEGDIIIVDQDKGITHGCYVIALLKNANEITFKQYVEDGGKKYLKPLNPQYPLIIMDKNTPVLGVVGMTLSILN